MTGGKDFDYFGTAQKIAALFPALAQFESPEMAMSSPTMTECRTMFWAMTPNQFFLSVAIALTFNVQPVPADNTLDDVSDAYLGAHPEMQKKLDDDVGDIEKLRDEDPGMKS